MNWKVLYVGPAHFNPESWKTRAEYILPDLFSALGDGVQIHLLTARVPDFARDSLQVLLDRFHARHHEIGLEASEQGRAAGWIGEVTSVAWAVSADVITNLFGSQWLGQVISEAAARCGAKAIVRVPGDEIGSRVAMGVYRPGTEKHRAALETERAGFLAADRIIAMSPWEAERIGSIAGSEEKVAVCIRGVDVDRFVPRIPGPGRASLKRVLYVGRKSAEKGFDLVEAAARQVLEVQPGIEFVFVGNFAKAQVENRTYLGWFDTADLPALYRSADAFVLASRSEGFPQVVAEAMASGLPCVLPARPFSAIFEHGKDALLCDLSPGSVAQQVVRLARDPALQDRLGARSRQFARASLDQRDWSRRYADIMRLRPVASSTPLDAADEPGPALRRSSARSRPRLLFVSPRPLGLLATPGTYLSIEAYAEHCELEVIAKPVTSSDEIIVHAPASALATTLLDPDQADYAQRVKQVVHRFRPDLICLAAWPGLHHLVRALGADFPDVRLFLEVKSPVISRSSDKRARNTAEWERVAHYLAGIVAPSRGMVESYLPGFDRPFLEHRSIIDFGGIGKKPLGPGRLACRKFVFSGSLARVRRIDGLLQLVAQLPDSVRRQIRLDVFGDGEARRELEAFADRVGLRETVRFMGAVPQAELFRRYRDYDAGIAWVPGDLYGSAPSLKLIEYCAAGIAPLATATDGHLLLKDHGLHVEYFEEHDAGAFTALVTRFCTEGVETGGLRQNIAQAEAFDYRRVIAGEILPFYLGLGAVGGGEVRENASAPLRVGAGSVPIEQAVVAWREQAGRDAGLDPDGAAAATVFSYERVLHAKRMLGRPGFLE